MYVDFSPISKTTAKVEITPNIPLNKSVDKMKFGKRKVITNQHFGFGRHIENTLPLKAISNDRKIETERDQLYFSKVGRKMEYV